MEDFLVYLCPEVVRHAAHERSLREIGYFGCRYQGVHLRVDGSGCVLPVDGDGLPLLEYLAEAFRKVLAVSPTTCPEKIFPTVFWITFASFFTVVTGQLGEVLKPRQTATLLLRAVAIRLSIPRK